MLKVKQGDVVKIVKLNNDVSEDSDLFIGKIGTVKVISGFTHTVVIDLGEQITGKRLETRYQQDDGSYEVNMYPDEIAHYKPLKKILDKIN